MTQRSTFPLLLVAGLLVLFMASPLRATDDYRARFHAIQKDRAGSGLGGCISCHDGRDFAGKSYPDIPQWMGEGNGGRHHQAYKTLSEEPNVAWSRAIAARLHAWDGAGSEPTLRADCLSCHSFDYNLTHDVDEGDPEAVAEARERQAAMGKDGVGCEACHGRAGGSSGNDAWIRDHVPSDWKSREASRWLEVGMWDSRNLSRWADRCNECHVGDQDHVMDHTLLGAGHPDISSFELVSYLEFVPRHWEKTSLPNHAKDGEWAPVRLWAVGQVATLRDNVRRIADWASSATEGIQAEFSFYECASCHQVLEPEVASKWKAARQRMARPGEPVWNASSWAMVRPLLRKLEPASFAAWENDVTTLLDSVSLRSPRPGSLRTAARSLERRAGELLERIAPDKIDKKFELANRGAVLSLLRSIAEDVDLHLSIGPRAAEQAYKAMVVLYAGAVPQKERPANDSSITAALDELGMVLLQPISPASKGTSPTKGVLMGGNREPWQLDQARFDGTRYAEGMRKLARLLGEAGG
jgi:hypothetical protein